MDPLSAKLFVACLLLAPIDDPQKLPEFANPVHYVAWQDAMADLQIASRKEYWTAFNNEVRYGRNMLKECNTLPDFRNRAVLPTVKETEQAMDRNQERQNWLNSLSFPSDARVVEWRDGARCSLIGRFDKWTDFYWEIVQADMETNSFPSRRRHLGKAIEYWRTLPHPLDVENFIK